MCWWSKLANPEDFANPNLPNSFPYSDILISASKILISANCSILLARSHVHGTSSFWRRCATLILYTYIYNINIYIYILQYNVYHIYICIGLLSRINDGPTFVHQYSSMQTEDGVCCRLDLVSRAAAVHWQCRIQWYDGHMVSSECRFLICG